MPSIKLIDITKEFGTVKAIDHVSIEIANGEYVCVLGPTGSGKTTLLRLISGLASPTSGEIEFDGEAVTSISPEDRNAVYVPQQYALFPHLTVRENVAFGPSARGLSREESVRTADEMLRIVKLSHRADAFPSELSGGMQQRVALARGLAGRSPLLLLDEPLGALDARLRMDLRFELRKLAKQFRVTVIHVTHDQQEAMSIADRIAILRHGGIEQFGSPSQVYYGPASPFLANFVGGANFLEGTIVRKDGDETVAEVAGGLSMMVTDGGQSVGDAVIVSFRQERSVIMTSVSTEENIFQGRLLSTSLLGSFLRCSVDLGRMGTVIVKVPLRKALNQKLMMLVGRPVFVRVPRQAVMLFSRPKRALAVELEAF